MSWVKEIGIIGSAPQHHLGGKKATVKLLSMVNLQKSQKILVLGCGNGKTALSIARSYKCEVIGTDINPQSVLEANNTLKRIRKKLKGSVLFKIDDILNTSLLKNSFDRIVVESVLIMLPKDKTLKELYSLLAPKGLLVINEALRLSADKIALKKVENEFDRAGISWYLPSYKEWKQYFLENNFNIISNTGPISYNVKNMGIESFVKNPIKGVIWFFKMLIYREAFNFFLRIASLTKKANIKWGYCLWICKKI